MACGFCHGFSASAQSKAKPEWVGGRRKRGRLGPWPCGVGVTVVPYISFSSPRAPRLVASSCSLRQNFKDRYDGLVETKDAGMRLLELSLLNMLTFFTSIGILSGFCLGVTRHYFDFHLLGLSVHFPPLASSDLLEIAGLLVPLPGSCLFPSFLHLDHGIII